MKNTLFFIHYNLFKIRFIHLHKFIYIIFIFIHLLKNFWYISDHEIF